MKILLLAFSVFFLASIALGQQELIKSIGNTAKEKANAQDFNTTRNNKERGNLMDEKKSRQAAPAPATASPPPPASMETEVPAPTEPSGEPQSAYTFTSSARYQMEYLKKLSAGQEVDYSFGDQSVKMELKGMDISFITDSKNGVMITLDSKNKTATVMTTKALDAAIHQQTVQKEQAPVKVTKTGRTKTILGYSCEEVILESGGKKTEVWNAAAGIDMGSTFDQMMQRTLDQFPDEAFSGRGMLMEMTAYDSEGNPEIKMTMISLSKEPQVVNVGAFKITRL